jgi:hypothetical protein
MMERESGHAIKPNWTAWIRERKRTRNGSENTTKG